MKMKHELSDIDPQKMDSQKWDMLLDLLEHPEKYSETQKDELLGDEEVNELYQQLVETRQSLDFAKSKEKMKMPSIDADILHAPHQVSPVWNQLFIPQSGEHITHHIPRLLIIMEQGKGEAIHLLVMVVEQPFHPLFIFFCHHVIFFLFLLLYTSFPEINYP